MSINVTVNGNPVCVRRRRMVLSDLEQIRKNERDRRRRLRLEQVRQQSKEISCKLLERAKNLTKRELDRLERDDKCELKKMHERKIAEIQRKYQEDMEDIGLAHASAARQPDVEAIIESERQSGKIAAAERGREAMQRLREAAQQEDPVATQQERLRQVREVENVRSAMVARLSSKAPAKDVEIAPESSREEETVAEQTRQATPKKKKYKKLARRSPAKVVSKSNVKIVGQQHKLKSPRQMIVEVRRANSKSPKRPSPQARKGNIVAAETANTAPITVCKNAPIAAEVDCSNSRCNRDTDDQEPRKTVPTMKLTPTKADKVARYNPDDYKQKASDSNGSSSSSVSDDSSYFSDGYGDFILPKTTPKHHTSPSGGSKVQLYDHSTRQRNSYNQPLGLVERMNIRNEPNAEDAAREVIQSESVASHLIENRRLTAQKRGSDAILRERVRRDYDAMMKNLDHLTREERKLKALQPQCCTNEHMSQSRRKEVENDRQRRMDRAFENVLRDTNQPGPSRPEDLVERIITIPPRAEQSRATSFPEATWQNTPFIDSSRAPDDARHENDEEMSREEHILEMLKKVERQKRLLLREFGADLPNNIFSASMTPLFDSRQQAATERPVVLQPPPPPPVAQAAPSPEIKIINMSSSDETGKKTKTVKKKATKKAPSPPPPATTIETAVQTSRPDEIGAAKDKSTQVEIVSEDSKAGSPTNDTVASEPLEYVEPRVTVITPEVNDSSSSSSDGRVTGIIIEVDNKQQVRVTPKKRKSGSGKNAKRGSSRARSKPRSLPASNAGSPVKRSVTSAPSSRAGSPKKMDTGCATRSRSPERTSDAVVKGSVKVQAGPSRQARIVDSSIESSPPHSTPEAQENLSGGKPYRIIKHPTFKRVRETRDASDTSTSYASLPVPMPGSMQSARHQITPILEMLDSSANESARGARRNVSPVSTPETPSPRVMNIPSNIPHPERIGRILRYGSSFTDNGRADDSTLPTSTLHEHSTSTDQSYSQNMEQRRSARASRALVTRRSSKSSDYCSCANPTCELAHENVTDAREYIARTNNPEVLKKYEDLQNVCTERIASLTELIKRVRNEQCGMEFSMVNPADETSLMQLPPPRPPRSDLQSVQRLVEKIEAIHSQLAKTLQESQNIITNNVAPTLQTPVNAEVPTSSTSYETKSKGSASTSAEETPVAVATATRSKPRVIGNEPVQIDLDRLKRGRGPYTAMIMSTENVAAWPTAAPGNPHRHEEMVEKLSQEILEQSKSVNRSREKDSSNGDAERSLSRQRTPSPPQNLGNAKKNASPVKKNDDEVTRDTRKSPEPKNEEDFVPMLAGLPKIPRALPNVQLGLRQRPPPACGAYRTELGSPRHELSTIVEFDTPDTANRSQGSTRSTAGKSRRVSKLPSPVKSTTTSAATSPEKNQAKVLAKPSVHVAPLVSQNMARTIPRRLDMRNVGSPDEKFVCQSPVDRALSDKGTTKSVLSQGPCGSLEGAATRNDEAARLSDRLTSGKAERDARQPRDDRSVTPEEQQQRACAAAPASSTLNPDCESKNDKITSTNSSNSFSVLSGISEIVSTPTSELAKWAASSSEEIESALKKMGLGWAIVTLKKTREASALSSSSNSDVTPMNTARRTKSPGKKQANDCNMCGLPDFSDVSSISIKEASKSTERAVLMKARTSTPNIQNSNSSSGKSGSTTASSSGISLQDPSDSLTAPNLSLTNKR